MSNDPWLAALQAWPTIWLIDLLRYVLPAATVVAVLAYLPPAWKQARSVRERQPIVGQWRREILNSMATVLIFSANGAVIYAGIRCGWARIYDDPQQLGTAYLLASGLILLLAHDAWFYWTHRLLHSQALFLRAHRTHHQSVAPTPWAAYSFAPAEAVIQAVFLPLILLVLPLHPSVIFVFLAYMIVRNLLGHTGVELMPRSWLAGWWGRWFTTTLHHDLHHAGGRFNYGLYFTFWDGLCGTEHPDYQRRLEELVNRRGREGREGTVIM
jgi:Delta7-sterol 5-desaturase